MAKNAIQGTVLAANGGVSIAPGAQIEVRNPAGLLVPLWADRAGTQPHANPFLADNEGNFRVYADSGWVHVRAQKDGSVREWRDVPIGGADAPVQSVVGRTGAVTAQQVAEAVDALLPLAQLHIGKSTTTPAAPITGSLLSGAMLAAGAIVEQGANANGRYWRWESGLQVCTHTLTLQDALGSNILAGPWVYPAGFTAFPYVDHSLRQGLTVDATPPMRQRFGRATSALGLASVSLRAFATGDVDWAAGDVMTTDAFAIGRWK